MDKGVLIGFVIIIAVFYLALGTNPNNHLFIHPPSMFIVLGGTIAATLVHFPIYNMQKFGQRFKAFIRKDDLLYVQQITTLVQLAEKIKIKGALAVSEEVENLEDPFMKAGFKLIIDNTPEERIENLLLDTLDHLEKRHKMGVSFFEQMSKYAPGYGLIGTLIGLILLMATLSDPSSLGPSMAIALITTFYGSVLTNVVFGPIAGRLKSSSEQERVDKELMLIGLKSIARGESSIIIKETMLMFLSQKEQGILVEALQKSKES
ncbi:MAG: motility protein A [Rickettsiales bacterium]|nr:motility protein A [Rickettsiales bacterium]|tara:strand:- start:1942 stop:2730 length:789 start_codon:yes stop_codon:yes gene_type:complete